MPKKMSREELIDLTESIYTMYNKNTKRFLEEDEHLALIHKFLENINHPAGTDLIFYPELVGLPSNPSVYEIVDLAMKEFPQTEQLPPRKKVCYTRKHAQKPPKD
ncbi:MAG: hypothetical protein HFJ07_07615 [Lachnospiraceae bacterium]|nr:hypothetical protein [Lachnospiraceae bacterium]